MRFSNCEMSRQEVVDSYQLNSSDCWTNIFQIEGDYFVAYIYDRDDRDRIDVYHVFDRKETHSHMFGVDPMGCYIYASKLSDNKNYGHPKEHLIDRNDIEGSTRKVMGY